jgi:cytidylate kinase
MNEHNSIGSCLSFIESQTREHGHSSFEPVWRPRAVTISRQAGCGALAVAEALAKYLQASTPKDMPPWTVFDRNLVGKVIEEHNLPKRLEKFMPEQWTSEIQGTLDELFGLHPPSWLLVRQTAETILHLAKLGNVILIGRGANVVTSRLDNVFHVRLVGSLERRVEHIQQHDRLDRKAALEFIRREDKGRQLYFKKYYNKDISDPLLYHLVINTDLVPYEKAARIIGDAMGPVDLTASVGLAGAVAA